jgi:hypothetical protein
MPTGWRQKKPLSFRQRKAAMLLAVGWLSIGDVARQVGVRRETIWAWRQQPEFEARVADRERELDERLRYRRQACLEQVLTTLDELIGCPNPRVSLAAMKIVLRLNGRLS